jgi:hypothetical protein
MQDVQRARAQMWRLFPRNKLGSLEHNRGQRSKLEDRSPLLGIKEAYAKWSRSFCRGVFTEDKSLGAYRVTLTRLGKIAQRKLQRLYCATMKARESFPDSLTSIAASLIRRSKVPPQSDRS